MPDQPPSPTPTRPWRNFYGRRKGKALRPGQRRHLQDTLPRVRVPGVGWEENPRRAPIDPVGLFGRAAPVELEIGFGSGEHLAAQAAARPNHDFIGCEPFENGVATLLPRLTAEGLDNVRVHPGDARDLVEVLPAGAVSACHILYPDPWPKRRHHRRRIVSAAFLAALAPALAPGAVLRIATDIPDYARHSLEAAATRPDLTWTARGPADWRRPWPGWVRTRYEAKALHEGRTPIYLEFRRR